MNKNNRPIRREKNVTGSGGDVYRRGSGHSGGSGGFSGSGNSGNGGSHGGSRAGSRRSGGLGSAIAGMVVQEAVAEATGRRKSKKLLVVIAIVVIIALATGNFGTLMNLLGFGIGISDDSQLLNGYTGNQSQWMIPDNATEDEGVLNTNVASGARNKRTEIIGKGKDQVTVMVYLCGTDLESKSGMATSDLKEMINADLSKKVDVLVFTGGCSNWKNSTVSSRKNQIYHVTSKGIELVSENNRIQPMTDPDTLASFIKWSKKNYPANRYDLILWDHGGGSVSGYGYDELYTNKGTMTLDKIGDALKEGGCKFDFIGFDACLMATLETALVVEPYADYLIASEETEPGIGWYYTNWLSELADNTSMPTVKVGKTIVDDFVKMCRKNAPGQATTLSVIDLAELSGTVPASFSDFAQSTSQMIRGGEQTSVIKARAASKEFNKRNSIDQIDLVDFTQNLGTKESKALSKALTSAIKYNKTSADVANAHGISIYFPYARTSNVNRMLNTYREIDMDAGYVDCVKSFASLQVAGQAASGGQSAQIGSLFDALTGSHSSAAGTAAQLIGALIQGRDLSNVGLDSDSAQFLDTDLIAANQKYLEKNAFEPEEMEWSVQDGQKVMKLREEQWDLLDSIELSVFADDGEGYVDLGRDNIYDFDEEGNLIGDYDNTWLAINDHFVAYYMLSASGNQDDYTILGRVPAELNGEKVDLIISFTDEVPDGKVLGAQVSYEDEGLLTEGKGLREIKKGDRIDFLCDYYDYNKRYQDRYYLGEQLRVKGELKVSNKPVNNTNFIATYRLTDIYQNHYYTPEF